MPRQPYTDSDFFHAFTQLTPAEQEIARTWRAFLLREVAPIINDYWERGEFPMALIPKIGALVMETIGKGQTDYPKTSHLLSGWLSMEVGRVDPSLGSFLGVHRRLGMNSIRRFGSAEQKAYWLPKMLRFEKICSWVLTEPEVGSDASGGLRTTASQDGDSWVLNGSKKWSGNCTFADVNVIWAKNTQTGEVNGFLVELGTPGYLLEKITDKISKRVVQNANITLENCRIPLANRLPGAERFRDVSDLLAEARADVAWESVGIARGAYEHALAYANQREQFGKPISSYQLIQMNLAKMLGNITAMLAMMVQLTALQQEQGGRLRLPQSSLAKAWCSESMRETVSLARAVLGGNGILLEYNVARYFADAEALYSYEGTYEINSLIVGREITGHSAFV
jgi:glutaryl-CoA dehydrogenase